MLPQDCANMKIFSFMYGDWVPTDLEGLPIHPFGTHFGFRGEGGLEPLASQSISGWTVSHPSPRG